MPRFVITGSREVTVDASMEFEVVADTVQASLQIFEAHASEYEYGNQTPTWTPLFATIRGDLFEPVYESGDWYFDAIEEKQ